MPESTVWVLLGGATIFWLCLSNKGQDLLMRFGNGWGLLEQMIRDAYAWMRKRSSDPDQNIIVRGLLSVVVSVAWWVWVVVCFALAALAVFGKWTKALVLLH